jgi:integrase
MLQAVTMTTPLWLPFPQENEESKMLPVALGQRRKDTRSMRRRSGQSGEIVRKGKTWHVRFYVDVPGQRKRRRKSVPVGPAVGKEKLTRPEATRKAAEVIRTAGVNTVEHLQQAIRPERIKTFKQRVEWCRKNHKAWTDGKPGPIATMESQLVKHILPKFGELSVEAIDEMAVQEFVADLKRTTFERRRRDGTLIKTYRLSRKTVLNVVGVVKLVLSRKVWMTWELDLGKPNRPKQRYFTQEQLRQIIEAAPDAYKVLFALLAGTGMRIGEAAGLHLDDLDLDNGVIYIRRGVWNGQELDPKTDNAVRVIDIDPGLVSLLREHVGESRRTRVFEARNGSPLSAGNIRNRVLHPLLAKLGIPKALHAFRHSRVTILRKNGTPADLQKQWIGHSSLKTTDGYSHTDQELEYRRNAAGRVGLDLIVGPKRSSWTQSAPKGEATAKATA